ncbi:hypothetical protein [uncultured Methanobacterium sp.]|nr:hypothetical protein [uncultured Methanobacterium sp.]
MVKYKYIGAYPGITDGIGPAKPGELKDLDKSQAKIAEKSSFWKKGGTK